MKLFKARKELKFVAVLSIFLGVLCFLTSAISFFWLNGEWDKFTSFSDDQSVKAVVSSLLSIIKLFLFMMLPGFGLSIVGVGLSILRFLKIENEGSQNKT